MLGGYTGRVMVGDKRQPICIPAGMSKVVVGRTQDKLPKGPYVTFIEHFVHFLHLGLCL